MAGGNPGRYGPGGDFVVGVSNFSLMLVQLKFICKPGEQFGSERYGPIRSVEKD